MNAISKQVAHLSFTMGLFVPMLHSRISRSIIGNCSTKLYDDLKEYHIKFQTFELDFNSDVGT